MVIRTKNGRIAGTVGTGSAKGLIFVLSIARAPYMEIMTPCLDKHHTARVPLLVFFLQR